MESPRHPLSTTVESAFATTIISTTTIFTTDPSCQLTFDRSNLCSFYPTSLLTSLTVDDFNGDTYLDLAFIDNIFSNLYVLIGNNSGAFAAPLIYKITTTDSPWAIVSDDFDNDGRKDLAVANYGSSTVDVFMGNGNGTFRTQRKFPTGLVMLPMAIIAVDFDSDTHIDLIVYGADAGIMFGRGDGSFSTAVSLYDDDGAQPNLLTCADINDDSYLDLFIIEMSPDVILILLNNGHGYCKLWQTLSLVAFSGSTSLSVADFNNDDLLDIAITNSNKANIGIFIQQSNGSFGQQTIYSTGIYSNPRSVVAADFNHDDQIDLVVSLFYKSQVGVWPGVGDGTFLPPTMYSTGPTSSPNEIITGDLNNDNRLDFIVLDRTYPNMTIFLNSCACCLKEPSK
ncbi:unnamed protein product [Adineta ricciae]|uniref:VCBS repeat-containing protein n=1 Tax=Adineta ricciae TaxID=249248 RepID=A0A816F5E3_ADIRI|nr:unnamed protein product [Adineta ricciae]